MSCVASNQQEIQHKWRAARWLQYLITIASVAALTFVLHACLPYFPLGHYPIPYVLLTMAIAYFFGEGPTILAFILSFFAYDYFFVPPLHTIWPLANTLEGWTSHFAFLLGMAVVAIAMVMIRRSRMRVNRLIEDLGKANRTLTALSRVNEILVRATEESELLGEACRILVDVGQYRMAWFGFAENDAQKTVRPTLHAGYENGYLDKVDISWGDNELGRGPTGTAIRTGRICVASDLSTERSYQPWREEATRRGYGCSISLPLTTNGNAIGAITLYRAESGCVDPQEEGLLSQMASDLSYGITALRTKRLRSEAVAERRALEQRMEEHKRKFYHETILSVTEGKLDICEAADLEPYIPNAQIMIDVRKASDVAVARREIDAFCGSHGLSGDMLAAFIIAAGEAVTNALKHGNHSRAYAGNTDDELWVGVKDRGPGIESLILPGALLRRGFSTKPSLGLGYTIMLDVADHILLNTGAHGTTVVLIKFLRDRTAPSLDAIVDVWAGISDAVS